MAYINVKAVRDAGVTPKRASKEDIEAAIATWTAFIDRITGQWFESRALTVQLDGTDTDTLFLPVPVITLTSLHINGDFVNAVAATDFRLYNRAFPDDRRNPRVKLITNDRFQDVFTPPVLRGRGPAFMFGKQNQQLIGNWGFVETDGTTPLLIQRALLKLAVKQLSSGSLARGGGSLTGSSGPAGPLILESTDGHTQQWGNLVRPTLSPGSIGVTGDPEVDEILKMYKRPIKIGVPLSATFLSA